MSKDNKEFFKVKNSWSIIKDSLLKCYLVPYFQKLMSSNIPICYIDCFAGKGKFEDGENGSPLLALDIINSRLQTSNPRHNVRKIEAYFIESKYADELERNIRDHGLECKKIGQVVSGKFEEQIEGLLHNKRRKNVFLYIDPYGIKSLDANLFCSFNDETYGFRTIEMLINFNSFGVLRCACAAMEVDTSNDDAFQGLEEIVEITPTEIHTPSKLTALVNKITGGNYWKDIVRDYKAKEIDGYEAEERLTDEYKKRLMQYYRYVLDIPIRLKRENHPKYRMIHVCNHEDGCVLMAENMLKRKEELFVNIQHIEQLSIFNIPLSDERIKKMILAALSEYGSIGLTKFLAKFFTDNGLKWGFQNIRHILKSMEANGEINVIRNPSTTENGGKRTFWSEGKEQKVILRRK